MRAKAILLAALLAVSLLAPAAMPATAEPEATGEVSLSASPASSGQQFDYVLNDAASASNLSVTVTGVDNVAAESTSGTLSSGTAESVDVASDEPPADEQITLSAPYDQRDRSVSGSVAGSGSETISASGSYAISDATVDLQGVTPPSFDNRINGAIDNFKDPKTIDQSVSVSAPGKIDSIDVAHDNGNTADVFLHLPDGSTTATKTLGSDEVTVTYDANVKVDSSYTITLEATADSFKGYSGMRINYADDSSVTVDGSSLSDTGSATIDLSSGSNTINFADANGTLDYTISWTETDAVADISGTVGGSSISTSGALTSSTTKSVDLSDGSNSVDLSYSGSSDALDYDISWNETTVTTDPKVTVNGNSDQISGSLSDGTTQQLSVSDDWLTGGRNNVSITTNSPSGGPASVVGFEYSHGAATTINTTATSTQFESSYNVSHTYRNATTNATVLLPFDSGRVVEINNLEYRINSGSWESLADSEYTFDGAEITADISAAYGGQLPEDSTVDVRSTGRKIEVRNGAISVTDATAPGDELDTNISIDSKSDGFAINVGPTESGSRVHYGLSDDFGGSGPTGSAVIEANGDQHVEFPNALAGDSVRMNHLKTQVMPQSGDVRIAVEKAGSEPELDISPGPGGAGDPVEYRYYRTQTGSEYLLQSLTQGIILDSDVAESPAVLEDDDSDELLSILLDTGGDGGGGGGDSGVVGPIQSNTGMDIPFINDSPLSLLGLLVAIGAGASLYFSGSRGFGTASRVGDSVSDRLRSSIPLVGGLLGTVTGLLGSLAASTGSGLASLAGYLRRRPRLAAGLGGVLSLAGVVFGVIPLPTAAVFAVAVPLVSFVLLREIGRFSFAVWAITSAIGLIVSLVTLGVDFGGLVNEQTSLILAVGGLYLAYQAIQIWRQGNINRIVLNRGD